MGQSQLQKALRNRKAMARKVSKRNMAAGCTRGIWPPGLTIQIHQGGDGKPALDTCGTLEAAGECADFKLTNPKVELQAEPEVEEKECSLKTLAIELGMIFFCAAEELFLGVRS